MPIVFMASFVIAGIWLATGIDGDRILSADAQGPSSPLGKTVILERGGWLANFHAHAALWAVPAIALLAAIATSLLLKKGRSGAAFVASSVTRAGTILTAGVALFPFLMPSSAQPGQGLTVWDASSSAKTLAIMLIAVIVFLPVVLMYTAWVFHVLKGRVTLEEIRRHTP